MAINKYLIFLGVIILALAVYYFYNTPSVAIPIDDITIINPRDLEDVSGVIRVNGEADDKYSGVYYRVDLSEWQAANGINNWEFSLDTSKLSKETHVIYVKAGENVKAVRINVV